MRKLLFLLILLMSLTVAHSVLAGNDVVKPGKEAPEPVPFVFVISEKDDFKPENEYSITFAKTITLKAEAPKGAKVTLAVRYAESLEIPPEVYETVTVGATLKYIQPVKLLVGDNIVSITVEKDGFAPFEFEALVKRKDSKILESLQNMIIIPGLKK